MPDQARIRGAKAARGVPRIGMSFPANAGIQVNTKKLDPRLPFGILYRMRSAMRSAIRGGDKNGEGTFAKAWISARANNGRLPVDSEQSSVH
jgi:hypothetical protein